LREQGPAGYDSLQRRIRREEWTIAVPGKSREALTRFARALVDQHKARVLIPPRQNREGFWFGAGNLVEAPSGALYLVGRYRDEGDSRTGTGSGERGLELAIFVSYDRAKTFSRLLSFGKADLNIGGRSVVSIEGAKLHFCVDGVELFLSSEKTGIGYPPGLESFHKPGTGVWTIDCLRARSVQELKGKEPVTIVEGSDPRWLHVKDPVVFDSAAGDTLLYFCTHPFNWSSANSALAVRKRGQSLFSEPDFHFFPRGFTWDVAISRITGLCRLPLVDAPLPAGGILVFYDGGESLRQYEEHTKAVKRPRGYSCEELGGLGLTTKEDFHSIERLSVELPFFVSPHGTGCSRYVSLLETDEGYYATWQQSQPDRSQPLVMSFLPREDALRALRS
jgi:hypothetical protein